MATIEESIEVEATPARAYEVWRDVARWPRFLMHVKKVEPLDETRFRWTLELSGMERDFVSEITESEPDERLGWKTLEGVDQTGLVTFHELPDGRCRISLQIDYQPEGFAERFGAMTGLTDVLANYDLGQLKELVEGAPST